ncbi:hypothetical protein BU26DRAFT_518961 [Trematosphaeria pertusa]|uniref:N-acetyltransferase domain-containing protein n=1 Tax=Trematosphaeria pertusa TaxID=390896 RepID=A0A6A6IDT2_9PLEO|nr:uncharacterized protein BU26DRAFT_518961 [Trematosphaeria pertusa]KAF2248744.1 hypothetical protein BU26DRAFT_518961 [Trematosphaeria pertusa]
MPARQLPPSHLKVPPTPTSYPQRFLGQETVVVNHYANTDKLIPAIPGFRTSAAFLTSLSANLRIDPDLPSPLGTPNSFRPHNAHLPLPPPSPLSFHTISHYNNPYPSPAATEIMSSREAPVPAVPSNELPSLTTYTAESEDDRIDGLKLVADSVAQQRQVASKMLIFHPVNLAAYFLVIAILAQRMWHTTDDLYLLGTTIGGITMACLTAVRFATGGYLTLAEEINWDWLGDDRLIVVKWGEEVIGALVLGWADAEAAKKLRGGRRRRGKAVVRAWTVKLKYRGKGVGEGLLEEAVKVAGERGADGIVFERDHANSKRILPGLYNGFLNKKEARAEKRLEKVADEKGNFRQRRSSPTWGSR